MKLFKIITVLFFVVCTSGCSLGNDADVYTVSVEPYSSFVGDDVQNRECRIEFGDEVFISGSGAWFGTDGIQISEGGVYTVSGSYDGCIYVSSGDPVKLVLSDANITNDKGCAVRSDSSRLIISSEGGSSSLTGNGGRFVTAVYSKGALMFEGTGGLSVSGNSFAANGIMFGRTSSTICEIIHGDKGDLIYGSFRMN